MNSNYKETFEQMKIAGALAADALDEVTTYVTPGVTTNKIDKICYEFIKDNGGYSAPLFYKGFPKSCCTSVNHVVCHGIPSNKYLNSYLKNSENPGEISQYWIAAQKEINSENQTKFFKTHNALCSINGNSFTDKKNTLATVYIVRDPRNVITSLSNHYGLSIDKAYYFFTNKSIKL